MAITFTNLGSSTNPDIASTADQTSYANSSWTPPTSGLIYVFVASQKSTAGAPNEPTISGNNLTWTSVKTVTSSDYRLTLFGADASGSTTGATTVDFGGQTQTSCCVSFGHADVDLSGGVASAIITYSNTGSSGSGSVTLGAASGSDNRPISGWFMISNLSMTPRTSWTETDELVGAGQRLEAQYRSDAFETTASVTWGGSTQLWYGIAAELKATTGEPGELAVTQRAAAGSDTDGVSFTTASFTPSASSLIVASFTAVRTDSTDPLLPSSVTGGSLTWYRIADHIWRNAGTTRLRSYIYAAQAPASPSSMTVTFTWAATTHGACWSVCDFTGSDVPNGVEQSFVQNKVTGTEVSGTSLSLTLDAAGNAANRPFLFAHHAYSEGTAWQTSPAWTEISDFTQTITGMLGNGVGTAWMPTEWDPDAYASWTTSELYCGIAVEIKAYAPEVGEAVTDAFGMFGFFGA